MFNRTVDKGTGLSQNQSAPPPCACGLPSSEEMTLVRTYAAVAGGLSAA
jgi:hypothetical protein